MSRSSRPLEAVGGTGTGELAATLGNGRIGREVLVFRVGRERFAMAVDAVEAVTEMPVVRPLPAMPSAMLGVCELRGALIAVYSPAEVLRVPLGEPGSIIVAWSGRRHVGAGRRVAIAITEAEGVTAFDPHGWRGVGGSTGVGGEGLVLGVTTRGTAVITLVDGAAFLSACTSGRSPDGS